MDPGPSRSPNREWDEVERVRLFTEILLQARDRGLPSPSQILYEAIQRNGILPQFDELPLSGRRSLKECIRIFDSYGSQHTQYGMQQQGSTTSMQYYNDNRKRPYQETFVPGTRAIAPRPISLQGDPSTSRLSMSAGPMTPLEGPSPTLADSTGQRKKRGRPTKLEQQRRQMEAQASQAMNRPTGLNIMSPQPLPDTPFSPGHAYRHSIAGPIGNYSQIMVQPAPTPQRPPTEASTGSGGSEGRRGRGRPRKNIGATEIDPPASFQLMPEPQPSGSRRITPPRQSKEPKTSRSTRSPSYPQTQHRSPGKGTSSFTSQLSMGDMDEGGKRAMTTTTRRIWEEGHQ